MKSIRLYQQLEKDFIKPGLTDDWFQYMGSVADFLTDNFKQRSMGLVCDFNTDYFEKLGLASEFIEELPVMEDL